VTVTTDHGSGSAGGALGCPAGRKACCLRACRRAAARLALDERGSLLLELVVAMTLVLVMIAGTTASLDHNRRLSTVAEKQEAASNVAEQALEQALALPYGSLALSAAPAGGGSPPEPLSQVVACGGSSCLRWNYRGPTASSAAEPFVLAAAADPAASQPGADLSASAPWQQRWDDGHHKGTLYRFVTWAADPAVSGARHKRVTVEVTVDGAELKKPVLVSSIAGGEG